MGINQCSAMGINQCSALVSILILMLMLHSLAELVPWNRFLDFLKVKKSGPWRAGTTTLFLLGS
jgi:hypothetical protein